MTTPANWLALCALLALGESCGFAMSRYAAAWPVAALSLGALTLALYAAGMKGLRFAVAFLAGLILALHAAHQRNETLAEALWRGSGSPFRRILVVEGEALEFAEKDGVSWTSFPSSTGNLRLKVVFPRPAGDELPRVGERWECAGWLARTKGDDPSRRRVLWVKGRDTFARRVESARGAFAAHLARLKAALSRRMGLGLEESESAANLNRAILLGERTRLAKSDRDAFIAAGTIHVFAISGLHVMMVAGALSLLLSLCGVPARAAGIALLPILWMYVAMTGFGPSAVRAAAMVSMSSAAPVFWRKPDGLVSWSITFLAVYSYDPMKFYDTGCALSFAVMLGIVFWGRFSSEFVKSRVLEPVVMSLAIWAVGMPIAARTFGRITPGGILANLALVPAAGISVKAALAGILASLISDRLAAYVNNFAALVSDAMSALSRVAAHIPGANVEVEPWSAAECIAWYAALSLLLFFLRRLLVRRKREL